MHFFISNLGGLWARIYFLSFVNAYKCERIYEIRLRKQQFFMHLQHFHEIFLKFSLLSRKNVGTSGFWVGSYPVQKCIYFWKLVINWDQVEWYNNILGKLSVYITGWFPLFKPSLFSPLQKYVMFFVSYSLLIRCCFDPRWRVPRRAS